MDFEKFVFPGPVNFRRSEFASNHVSFNDAQFRGSATFDRAVFQSADFEQVEFCEEAWFVGATFAYLANFRSARFTSIAFFQDIRFEGVASFDGAVFRRTVELSDGRFNNVVYFRDTLFIAPPDLRSTRFEIPPSFEGAMFPYRRSCETSFWRRALHAAEPGDAQKYRYLKQLAGNVKDHDLELCLFAQELRAKRFYETRGFWPVALNVAYDFLSGYGLSLARPLFWLGLTTGISAVAIAIDRWSRTGTVFEKAAASLMLAITNTTLFLGVDKWEIRKDAARILYGTDTANFGFLGDTLAWLHSGFSLLLFFLIALALRNRFRVGGSG